MDINAIIEDSVKFAKTAVDCDIKCHVSEAIFYYKVGCQSFGLRDFFMLLVV